MQVLGIALMAGGLLVDRSARNRAGRIPLLLFWIGAVLLVLGSY
jgi:hypothetical protein